MNRCLRERALLRVFMQEGTAAEHSHLKLCADCAERYDQLVEELEIIGQALEAPPRGSEHRHGLPLPVRWMTAAIAVAALGVLVLDVARLRHATPVQIAHASSVSAFAADLSAALFPTADTSAMPQLAAEAPYLEAALEMGQPCTQSRFLAGECNDQLSAVLIESE